MGDKVKKSSTGWVKVSVQLFIEKSDTGYDSYNSSINPVFCILITVNLVLSTNLGCI